MESSSCARKSALGFCFPNLCCQRFEAVSFINRAPEEKGHGSNENVEAPDNKLLDLANNFARLAEGLHHLLALFPPADGEVALLE